jgi:hypothetical protein
MSYKINKTDGVLLVDLIDGRIDTVTTDLVLIGRNFTGYGELFNENFIKLLENFAAVSPPSKPLEGQLWYDKSDGRLKVWNGEQFRSTDTTVVSAIQPQLLAGDIWIDSRRQQLYFNDGTGIALAGPIFTRDQGPTGFKVETINDRFGNPKTVAKLIVNSTELALISREPFEAALNQPGFGKNIQEGININSNRPDFEFRGTAARARQLIDGTGDVFIPDNFLKINANNVTTGTFHINNDSGLRVGNNVSFLTRMLLSPKTVIHEILDSNANYKLTVNRNAIPIDAIFVNTQDRRVGIWTNTPITELDVNGSLRVTGDLIVEGNTTVLEVENLKIQDKLIELATTANSTIGDNIAVDNSGITILSSDGSKDWVWRNSTNSWTSNVNINLANDRAYKIDGSDVLSKTELFPTVTRAVGLNEIGTLINLTAANFTFNSSTMTVTNALTIDSANDIIISNNKKITGVGNPTDLQDVATKNYVDARANSESVRLALDITGLTNADIGNIILALYPSGTRNVNTKAFISTSAYSGSVVTNPTTQTTKSFVAVDSGGVQNQSVVQDFSFTNATNSVTLTVTRGFKTYIWNGVIWQFLAEFIDP